MGLGALKGHYIFAHEGSSYETYIRLFETAGTGPARCAFSVGLEFGGQTLRDSAHEASLR